MSAEATGALWTDAKLTKQKSRKISAHPSNRLVQEAGHSKGARCRCIWDKTAGQAKI
jgi:hypothetical protein